MGNYTPVKYLGVKGMCGVIRPTTPNDKWSTSDEWSGGGQVMGRGVIRPLTSTGQVMDRGSSDP